MDEFQNLRYFNNEVKKSHIRYAPLDGIFYATVGMMYTSITQLLIRKKVFDCIGGFLTDHGSIADFEWEMRASLVFNTIHVPEYLATWRVHEQQASNDKLLGTAYLHEKNAFFIKNALKTTIEKGLLKTRINVKRLQYENLWVACQINLKNTTSLQQRLTLITPFFLNYPFNLLATITRKMLGLKKISQDRKVQKIIKKYKLQNLVEFI